MAFLIYSSLLSPSPFTYLVTVYVLPDLSTSRKTLSAPNLSLDSPPDPFLQCPLVTLDCCPLVPWSIWTLIIRYKQWNVYKLMYNIINKNEMWRYNCSESDILSTREKCKAKVDPELKLPKFLQHGK